MRAYFAGRVWKFFRQNPGLGFVVAFQVLLVAAAVSLVSRATQLANDMAVYAFYALVIGIAIQVAKVIREERRHGSAGTSDG